MEYTGTTFTFNFLQNSFYKHREWAVQVWNDPELNSTDWLPQTRSEHLLLAMFWFDPTDFSENCKDYLNKIERGANPGGHAV